MGNDLEAHLGVVIRAIAAGRLVPFLGAGVNLCGRPPSLPWQPGQQRYLPSGGELAAYLADHFGCPPAERSDLARICQYVAVMEGLGPLYEGLRSLFDADYPSTPVHRFFAGLPSTLRAKGHPVRHQVIVTTNYDDLMERAYREAGQPYDLVTYITEGDLRGRFWHTPPDGQARVIEKPNEYRGLMLDERPAILKIHGAVDRGSPERDSFVITEDHYIDYLTRTDLSNLIPIPLPGKLRKSHFLFLGYGLRDWNLRVILHRISGEQKLPFMSWAIQLHPDDLDRRFWMRRDVEILDVPLDDYIAGLQQRIQQLPSGGGSP